MIGNQVIINSQVLAHDKNPIKDKIGDKHALDIIYIITDEYWKEWRRKLTNTHHCYVYAKGLGTYSVMYGRAKNYLRKMVKRLRQIKNRYPDKYLVEGTFANGLYTSYCKRFRDTWKQIDNKKKEVIKNQEVWKQKKIKKYGDKAIL